MSATKERPILFSGPMVRAILEGRKTVTRRVYKPREGSPYEIMGEDDSGKPWPMWFDPNHGPEYHPLRCPYGSTGERLWVKETWAPHADEEETARNYQACIRGESGMSEPGHVRPTLFYRADGGDPFVSRWRPSIHMPRWASRLTLEVLSVRVERLHELSEDDARAEGVREVEPGKWACYLGGETENGEHGLDECHSCYGCATSRASFETLWRDINGAAAWDANPWVWAVSFRRLT